MGTYAPEIVTETAATGRQARCRTCRRILSGLTYAEIRAHAITYPGHVIAIDVKMTTIISTEPAGVKRAATTQAAL